MIQKITPYFILFIIFSIGISAVGIGSTNLKPKMDFVPGATTVLTYQIFPTVNYKTDYKPILLGNDEFVKYATIEPPIFKNMDPSERPYFNIIFNFPSSYKGIKPGMHTIRILVGEGTTGISGGMGAKTQITLPIYIRVLSEEKIAYLDINAENANIGENVKFDVSANSWTKQKIEKARVELIISDPQGEYVTTFTTETLQINSGQKINFKQLQWDTTGQKPGEYSINGVLHYDGKEDEKTVNFRVGTLTVNIDDFSKKFIKGKINPFIVNISSDWNNPLNNLEYKVDILSRGNKVHSFKSLKFSLGPLERKNIKSFFDPTNLANINDENFKARVTLSYEGKKTTKTEDIQILSEEKEIKIRVEEGKGFQTNSTLILIIIILIILNNVWMFIAYNEKHKNKKESK